MGTAQERPNGANGASVLAPEAVEVIAYGLVAVIELALLADDPPRAALLAGVGDAVLAESGVELLTGERARFEEAKASTRAFCVISAILRRP